MGDIVLAGATSGTITLQPTAVAGSSTLTLPAANATVLTSVSAQSAFPPNIAGNGPAFSATNTGGQSFNNGAFTKIQFGTEEFDTANCFDSTTNYRFTPNVAGYYQFNGGTGCSSSVSMFVVFYKNGSEFKRGQGSATGQAVGSALIYCNGSTDYVELYLYNFQGTTISNAGGASQNYFQASMVRAA